MSKKSRKTKVEEVDFVEEVAIDNSVLEQEEVIVEQNEEVVNKQEELINEQVIQLNIYENRIVDVLPEAKRVVVENIGGGDVYIDVTAIQFNPKTMLTPNNKREFKGVDKLFIGSASRPIVKISFFKK